MGVLSRPVLDGQSAGLGPGVGRPLTSLRGFKNRLTAVLAAWAMLGRRARAVFFDFLRGAWAGRSLFGNLSLRGRLMWRGLTLRRWHGLAALLLAWQSGRLAFKIARYVAKLPERNALWQRLRTANDYDEWAARAQEWDAWRGTTLTNLLQPEEEAYFVDAASALRAYRKAENLTDLMFALRIDLRRSGTFEFMHRGLSSSSQYVPLPAVVRTFLDEVTHSFEFIVQAPESVLSKKSKISFFREMRHAYGRTALVLSGGGSFGFFHFGVVRALLHINLLPRIVSGSSAGSIGSSIMSTRPESMMATLVDTFPGDIDMNLLGVEGTGSVLRHLVTQGTIQDTLYFIERLQRVLGSDITFADAYAISGRVLNVSVCAADTREPPRLLNYLTAPHVLVWSAVACSSAFPFLFTPQDLLARDPGGQIVRLGLGGAPPRRLDDGAGPSQERAPAPLLQRRWRDGSLEADLPMRGLGEMFNVNFFIVSQANPWVLPVLGLQGALPAWLGAWIEAEFKHRCAQLLHLFPRSALLKMLGQPWGGHVTMAMPHTLLPLGKAAQNLSPDDVHVAMQEGQLHTWRARNAMHAACAAELAIDAALDALLFADRREGEPAAGTPARRRRRRAHSRTCRARLPSWLHLGLMPASASVNSVETAEGPGSPRSADAAADSPRADRRDAGPDAAPSETDSEDEEREARHAWADVAALTVGGAVRTRHASLSSASFPRIASHSGLDFIAI